MSRAARLTNPICSLPSATQALCLLSQHPRACVCPCCGPNGSVRSPILSSCCGQAPLGQQWCETMQQSQEEKGHLLLHW